MGNLQKRRVPQFFSQRRRVFAVCTGTAVNGPLVVVALAIYNCEVALLIGKRTSERTRSRRDRTSVIISLAS